MDKLFLPEGAHYDLNIRHHRSESAGARGHGGPKLLLHTVESPRRFVDQAVGILDAKRAAPQFVYGYSTTSRFPVVVQTMPINEAGRALEHNFPQETNRANVVQIEICGFAAHSSRWSENYLAGLANLCALIHHRFDFPVTTPLPFGTGAKFSPQGFVNAMGIVGHQHVPGNNHTDPGRFQPQRFVALLKEALHTKGGLPLKPSLH